MISTRDYERDGTFTPDGKTFYFTKRTIWPQLSTICVSVFRRGTWREPEVAPFSGQFSDATPSVSVDGARLYFASQRPAPGTAGGGSRIWVVNRVGDGWSEPRLLPDTINRGGGVAEPIETRDGSLYFLKVDEGQVYVARRREGGWGAPDAVGGPADPGTALLGFFVDADERFLIVAVAGRPDALSTAEGVYVRGDLYVRERTPTGWGPLRHLDLPINSAAEESAPFVSPDGRYLYFTSERGVFTEHGTAFTYDGLERALHAPGNGLGDIYRVPFSLTGIHP